MKKNIDITLVLDRSGSMESIKEETIAGFNSFIKKQRKLDGKIKVSLIQFDDEYELVFKRINIDEVPLLDARSFVPRGTTALLDAIGKTIADTKKHFLTKRNDEVRKQVFFVIITDGMENASKEYSYDAIYKQVSKCEEKYGWEFIYLGANQDAIMEGKRLGIQYEKAMTFHADSKRTMHMFNSLSENICESVCGGKQFLFKKNQREQQDNEEDEDGQNTIIE